MTVGCPSGADSGSRIGSVRHVPPRSKYRSQDDDEVVLLAHMLGDGSFVKRQPIRYAAIDEANLTAVGRAARQRFGITPKRDEYAAARVTTLAVPAPYHLTHGKRNPIAAWLDEKDLFGLRSHEKFVPGLGVRPAQVAGRVCSCATCGPPTARSATTKARPGQVYYASTSRRLVDDVASLLLRFNVFSRMKTGSQGGLPRLLAPLHLRRREPAALPRRHRRPRRPRGEQARCTLHAPRRSGRNTNLDTIPSEVWGRVREVLVDQKMTHREFAASLGTQFCGSTMWKHAPSRERLGRVAEVLGDADLEVLATNDVFWDAVANIEPVGEEQVYDATVMGTHNFVANGIAAHNSLEQDADMVILLHRDDVYEKESTRPGEADLIVAKHRNGPTRDITVAFQGHYCRFVDMAH